MFTRVPRVKKIWSSFVHTADLVWGPRPFMARGRALAKIVSRLLKVVETQIRAQNDRNGQVYISTYNKVKL